MLGYEDNYHQEINYHQFCQPFFLSPVYMYMANNHTYTCTYLSIVIGPAPFILHSLDYPPAAQHSRALNH